MQYRLVDLGQKLEDGTSISLNSSFTLTEPKRLCITIYVNNGNAPNVNISELQIEYGNQASAYEAYQSQSYEINLGKNLFDKSNTNVLDAYFTANSGSQTLSADAGEKNKCVYIKCDANTTYTVQKMEGKRFSLGWCSEQPIAGTSTVYGIVRDYTAKKITITTGDTAKYLIAYIINLNEAGEITLQQALDTLQIERGSVATSYSAYMTPIELAKIGTYQDYIWNDGGTWKIHKEVGKVVLDGTETGWGVQNDCFRRDFSDALQDTVGYTKILVISDHFVGRTVCYRGDLTNGKCAKIIGTNAQVGFRYDALNNDVDAFKAWLSTHNTTVYYALATPTDTEITDAELVGQLEALLNYAPWYGDDQNVFLIPSAGADGTLILGAHNEPKPADEVLIDTHLKTVTLNGQNAYPLLKDGSSFFSLAPGDNIMYLTSDVSSDTGKAEIKFKQGFISI